MSNQDLLDVLKIEADEIEVAFKKASITGKGTPQAIAEPREIFIKTFLARYFPFPFRITKGSIRDSFGKRSASIDCVILHPNHPHTVDVSGTSHSLVFCDGVEAAIEIKPDITSKDELIRGLRQIESVKKLRRLKSQFFPRADAEQVKDSLTIASLIFSTTCKSDPIDTAKDIHDHYLAEQTPLEDQVDAVVINKIGIIRNYKILAFAPEHSESKQKSKGLFFEEWGDQTLAQLLVILNCIPGAEMMISAPFLPAYLAPLKKPKITKI